METKVGMPTVLQAAFYMLQLTIIYTASDNFSTYLHWQCTTSSELGMAPDAGNYCKSGNWLFSITFGLLCIRKWWTAASYELRLFLFVDFLVEVEFPSLL